VRGTVGSSRERARRATIRDIAERAGVSKGAVSYALNDRPGVSDETRRRILHIAEELGWYPNRAARALSAARADAVGLVLARPARTLALEPFFMGFLAGAETELASHSMALTLQLVRDVDEEIAVYRRWWGEHRVDGVLVIDVRVDDERLAELERLGLPAVVIGGPIPNGPIPSVWNDESSAVVDVVRYLAALGHARIAYVAGEENFLHTRARIHGFNATMGELELVPTVAPTDYSAESGANVTRRLLSDPSPPTAILFDSDLLAVTGLGVAQHMGVDVPDDLSIVGWDDSLISQVVHPPLTAITRDIGAYGALAASHLLAVVDGETKADVEIERGTLTPRGSTAPPRTAARRRARAK
jgi:DNA-binding LacI/PurR family transcriptional regulator